MSGPSQGTVVFDPDAKVLVGSRCPNCQAVHFPPTNGCPECFAPTTVTAALSREGRVRSFTEVHLGFPGFPKRYHLVEVVLPEDLVVVGQLVGADDEALVQIGMTVTVDVGPVRTDDQGDPVEGYRFVAGVPS